MPLLIKCPSCAKPLSVLERFLGTKVRCPGCQTIFSPEHMPTADVPQATLLPSSATVQSTSLPAEPVALVQEPPQPVVTPPSPTPQAITSKPPQVHETPQDAGAFERRSERQRDEADDDQDAPRRRQSRRDADEERRTSRDAAEERAAASARLWGPAFALRLILPVNVLLQTIGFVFALTSVLGLLNEPFPLPMPAIVGVFLFGVGLTMSWFICKGYESMFSLHSYALAQTGAILALIPCFGCWILSLPFGIWALVRLNDPAVRRHFRD